MIPFEGIGASMVLRVDFIRFNFCGPKLARIQIFLARTGPRHNFIGPGQPGPKKLGPWPARAEKKWLDPALLKLALLILALFVLLLNT